MLCCGALAMNITGSVIAVLELVGAVAFAISGAFAAIKKNADAFGVIFLGLTTAAGGGVMRDILLGIIPPKIFSDWTYIAVAAGSSLAVFIFALAARERFARNMDRIDRINNIFDAAGLGIFAVYGAKTVLDCGHQNVLLVLFISMLSGVGGGIIRDTLITKCLLFLKKEYMPSRP